MQASKWAGPWWLLSGLLLAGCASVPSTPPAAEAAVATAAVSDGDLVAAAQEYERLAANNRRQRGHYLLLAAETWRDEGRLDEVARVLEPLLRKKLSAAEALNYDLLQGEVLLSRGEAAAAETLLTVPAESIPENRLNRYLELRARALAANDKLPDAVAARLRLQSRLAPAEREDNRNQALQWLAQLPIAEREQILASIEADQPLRLWYEQSLRVQALIPARASIAVSTPVGTLSAGPDGTLVAEGYRSPRPVALLLPLSGEFASAGEALRDGFMAARFADRSGAPATVAVIDSGSDRASAVAALKAGIEAGARDIVGPLIKGQVDAVFAAAPPDVRVLALNQSESEVTPPAGQFQAALAPEEEGAIAAERLRAAGIERAAVLASDEDWANRAGAAFAVQFRAAGGRIIGVRRIALAAIKFGDDLDALFGPPQFEPEPLPPGVELGTGPAAVKQRMLPVLPPDGPQALFLAIRSSQGRMLMPQLRVRGQDGVVVVATSHIYTGEPNPRADEDLEGINVLDAPFLTEAGDAVLSRPRMAARLPGAERNPRLFAFGIDAWRLLPWLDYLRAQPGRYLEGASGQWLADAFGRLRRLPAGFRFRGGRLQPAATLLPASTGSALPQSAPAADAPPSQ
ncbi:MAG: penicillin-binding protein activator [Lysobacterales bacterium]